MMPNDHFVLFEFLRALAGDAPPDHFMELRYALPDGPGMGQVFEHPHHLDGLATRALHLGRHTDVYVGCAPRCERNGGREAVSAGYTLWVDCDDARSSAALRRFEPCPSVVIESGTPGHRHAYFLLSHAVERDELEHANRRLARALGGDAASTDAARILRPLSVAQELRRRLLPARSLDDASVDGGL